MGDIIFFSDCRLMFLKNERVTQWSSLLCLMCLMGWSSIYHIVPWLSLLHYLTVKYVYRRIAALVTSLQSLSPSGLVCWWGTEWALWFYITCNGEWSVSAWHGTALSWRHKPLGWALSWHETWKCLHVGQAWVLHTLGRRSLCSSWCVLGASTQ